MSSEDAPLRARPISIMPRWRYSLRAFLFVAFVLAVATAFISTHFARCIRSHHSFQWLVSRNVRCSLRSGGGTPTFWRFPDHVQVNASSADLASNPAYWHHINRLGPLVELELGNDTSSAGFLHCLQTHRGTLRQLALSGSELSTVSGEAISDCRELKRLKIWKSTPGETRFHVAPLPKLESISIIGAELFHEDINWLPKQPALKTLTISEAPLSPEVVAIICQCKGLERLVLRYGLREHQKRAPHQHVMQIVRDAKLHGMQFPHLALSSTDIDAILASSLSALDVEQCSFNPADLKRLVECERIHEISLNENELGNLPLPIGRTTPLVLVVQGYSAGFSPAMDDVVSKLLGQDIGTATLSIRVQPPPYHP